MCHSLGTWPPGQVTQIPQVSLLQLWRENKKSKNTLNGKIRGNIIKYSSWHSIHCSHFYYNPAPWHHSLPSAHPLLQLCQTAYGLPSRLFSPFVVGNLHSDSFSHQPRGHLLLEAVYDHSSPCRLHLMPPLTCACCVDTCQSISVILHVCPFNCPSYHTVSSLMREAYISLPDY